ncbi:MAG: VOC family protein [Candidatus Binatia bacterium]|jgi:catechol 2,3-dioxygenase-like lactoylglutathione lyase family enzyme
MELTVPILPVDDLGVAKQFYVDALGFSVAFEWTQDGKAGLLGVRRGSIELTLDCPMAGHGRHACVSLRVDDADRYSETPSSSWDRRRDRRGRHATESLCDGELVNLRSS